MNKARKQRSQENQQRCVRRIDQPEVNEKRMKSKRTRQNQPSETRVTRWGTGRFWQPALINPSVEGEECCNLRYRQLRVQQASQVVKEKKEKPIRHNPG